MRHLFDEIDFSAPRLGVTMESAVPCLRWHEESRTKGLRQVQRGLVLPDEAEDNEVDGGAAEKERRDDEREDQQHQSQAKRERKLEVQCATASLEPPKNLKPNYIYI